jgi:hypothetical protein
MSKLTRAGWLVVTVAAVAVVVSIFAVPWYRAATYADALTAWEWVPESGVVVGTAVCAGVVGLVGLVLGERRR